MPAAKTKTTDDPFGTDPEVTADGDKWVITIKGGPGYDAPWLVGHIGSLERVDEYLSNRDLVESVTGKLWDISEKFAGKAPSRPAGASGAGGGGGAGRRAPTGPPDGVDVPECNHGPMTYRTGITKSGPKAGETWKGFMCPQPKGASDQCKPKFL